MGNACQRFCQSEQQSELNSAMIVNQYESMQVNNSPQQLKNSNRKRLKPINLRIQNAHTNTEASNAIIEQRPPQNNELQLILNAFKSLFIFQKMQEDFLIDIISKMQIYNLESLEIIFEQGDYPLNFYIIQEGKIEILIDSKRKKVLNKGESFGELALIHNINRSATVKTLTRCKLWALSRSAFVSALESVYNSIYQENKSFIESVNLFQNFSNDQKEALIGSLVPLTFESGDIICREGESGDLFFIIKQGEVKILKEGTQGEVGRLSIGNWFGEQALLNSSIRTATVQAISRVVCLTISNALVTQVLGNQLQDVIYQNTQKIALERCETFKYLTVEQKNKIIDKTHIRNYRKDEIVIQRNKQKGAQMYIIIKGALIEDETQQVYEVCTCIGNKDIIKPNNAIKYQYDISALQDATISVINKEDFEQCIGGAFENVAQNNKATNVLWNVNIFRRLPQRKLKSIIKSMSVVNFENNQVIFHQNDWGDSLFIIKSGKVDIIKDGLLIRSVIKNDYFGERALLFNEPRTATVIARGKVSCFVIQKQHFIAVVEGNLHKELIKRIELQDDKIALDDLYVVKVLGNGMFGHVFLVKHRQKDIYYALKTVPRYKIHKYSIYENLLQERRIMMQLDHIFIVKLIKTFKDEARLYFLMEYVQGQDLFDSMRYMGLLTEQKALFYSGSLLTILEHLHQNSIVHRDLKPENVMVDEDGYIKLIDFGTAKIINGRTFTIVGTPYYMAPEVILGEGHNHTVDYWSLGAMIYEFLCGAVPFGEDETDPYVIYRIILQQEVCFPHYLNVTSIAKEFVVALLQKNSVLRQSSKNHAWFQYFNWNHLISKKLMPPYIPNANLLQRQATQNMNRKNNLQDVIKHEEDLQGNNNYAPGLGSSMPIGWDFEF